VKELSPAAKVVLEKRYLLRDGTGRIVESPEEMFERVAECASSGDVSLKREFFRTMSGLEFLPNSPTLMNAGTPLGQLSACFVLPVEDSLSSIFETLKETALIQQSGGGTGFSFSKLRPRGDTVRSTYGVASGPISFISIYNAATDVVKQGGKRRGANMGILSVDHPDILEFIHAKEKGEALSNFNISVSATDAFMEAAKKGQYYELINPRTEKSAGKLKASEVFGLIARLAWKTGDPGMIFIDEINRKNALPGLGQIEATNPCGEQPLFPHESCNLGSINLSLMTGPEGLDWEKMKATVRLAVEMLDNLIDANRFPVPAIGKMTLKNRKIGLGVMGFAEMLIKLGLRYDSEEALATAGAVMRFINEEGHKRSAELGEKKGSFPNFKGSVWERTGQKAMRNATVTTIAPTGTISMIADCSSGIEPIFAARAVKKVLGGIKLPLKEIAGEKKLLVTAHDISPSWHVRMQAAFQEHCDNGVSKTINLPSSASVKDVADAFRLAYNLKCKGTTAYRDKSKKEQVLYREDSGQECCTL